MKFIIVDQFKGVNFIDVYVMDDRINDMLEVEQGLSLAAGFKAIDKFKKEYGINTLGFRTYDEYEEIVLDEWIE